MSIAKAVGKEALALSEIKALETRVKAKVKERMVKVREKAEARHAKKATVTSGQAKVLVAETPALTTMILRSATVRLRERGKIEEETPRPLIPADALHHRRKRNALITKKATVLRVENACMRIPLRADSFLKVNAKTAKTLNSHTLNPNMLMQEQTLLTAPVGQLGMKQRGNLLAKQKLREKGKIKAHSLQRFFLAWPEQRK
jgi:hypothetical protein